MNRVVRILTPKTTRFMCRYDMIRTWYARMHAILEYLETERAIKYLITDNAGILGSGIHSRITWYE